MTYFGFLVRFLLIPILILAAYLSIVRYRRQEERPAALPAWSPIGAIGLHILIALLYTTPWDNYLVATRVWWYDPALVTGLTIGWVPIEEYTFFILQPILAGLWLYTLAWHLGAVGEERPSAPHLRKWSTAIIGLLWLAAVVILLLGWQPGTYLALELGWALPPIALQLSFGADILWRRRRLVLLSIIPLTLYLSGVDFLAIGWGTWTINPEQSLPILLGGTLPLEEVIFFLLTNTLLTFGLTLLGAPESERRLSDLRERFQILSANSTPVGK